MNGGWAQRRGFLKSVPASSYAVFLAGVFLMFMPVGLLGDIAHQGSNPPVRLAASMLFSGGIAVLYIIVAQRPKWLVLLIASHILLSMQFERLLPALGAPLTGAALQARLQSDASFVAALLIASFVLISNFAQREGSRYFRVHTEIALARDIHRLLVHPVNHRNGSFEFRGLSIPSGEVGGDLVDVVEADGSWIGYVADVSGHGVGAGLLMGMAKSAARTQLRTSSNMDHLLNTLNAVLSELKKPEMFITYAGIQYDGSRRLVFSVAGHLPILHYRAATARVEELSLPQVPLAMFEDQSFSSSRIEWAAGDLFVILTDGFTEVFDRRDQEFGLDRVKAVVRDRAGEPLERIEAALLAAVRSHGSQQDDQTLLLIRALPSPNEASRSAAGRA